MSMFKKAEQAPNRVILVRGQPGTGKTRWALGLKRCTHKPVAYIGTDRGARLYPDDPEIGGFMQVETRDIKTIRQAITELASGGYENFGAIVVDTTTDIYEAALAERVINGPKGPFVPRNAYKPVRDAHEELLRSLQALPLHVVFIMEEKPLYEKTGQGDQIELKEIGTIEDGNKKDGYVCDIRLRFYTEDGKFKAEVIKDRSGAFPMGKVITNPKPEMWIKGAVEAPAPPTNGHSVTEADAPDEPPAVPLEIALAESIAEKFCERMDKVKHVKELANWWAKHVKEIDDLQVWPAIHERVVKKKEDRKTELTAPKAQEA